MRALIKNTVWKLYQTVLRKKNHEFNCIVDQCKLKRRYDHMKVWNIYQLQKLPNPKMSFYIKQRLPSLRGIFRSILRAWIALYAQRWLLSFSAKILLHLTHAFSLHNVPLWVTTSCQRSLKMFQHNWSETRSRSWVIQSSTKSDVSFQKLLVYIRMSKQILNNQSYMWMILKDNEWLFVWPSLNIDDRLKLLCRSELKKQTKFLSSNGTTQWLGVLP